VTSFLESNFTQPHNEDENVTKFHGCNIRYGEAYTVDFFRIGRKLRQAPGDLWLESPSLHSHHKNHRRSYPPLSTKAVRKHGHIYQKHNNIDEIKPIKQRCRCWIQRSAEAESKTSKSLEIQDCAVTSKTQRVTTNLLLPTRVMDDIQHLLRYAIMNSRLARWK
jgi:hypothetical protein